MCYESECEYCERELLEEYMYKIKEIVEDEISNGVKHKTEELKQFEKKKMYYVNENINLKSQIRELQREIRGRDNKIRDMEYLHKNELDKKQKEFSKSPLEAIFGKWKDVDYVYYIDERSESTSCPHCNGKGSENIELENQKIVAQCRFCKGKRYFSIKRYRKRDEYIKNNKYIGVNGLIYYKDYGYLRELNDNKYYIDEKEVESKCSKRNKEQIRSMITKYEAWKNENNIK